MVDENNWLENFGRETTPDPNTFGYIPSSTNVQDAPEGSVYAAHWRQENIIGSLLNRHSTYELDSASAQNYDFTQNLSKIPTENLSQMDKYFGARTDVEFQSITEQLNQERKDKNLQAFYPWRSLLYALDPLEPTNYLPGGAIYKELKIGTGVAKSLLSVGLANVGASALSESVLQTNQLTRTYQESAFNILGAGLLGGIIGGGASLVGSKALGRFNPIDYEKTKLIRDDINRAINPDGSIGAARSNIMDNATIARMPEFIKKTMNFSPMNRLLNSRYKVANWFGSSAFEHNYELVKNSDGITSGISIERDIKMSLREINPLQIQHVDYFYDMHGVTGKFFKETKRKISSPSNMNLDQFNIQVYETALTGVEHAVPQVNASAKMWRGYFDKLKNEAVELKLLPEGVDVPNAVNYIMIMYNKNKIIEQGGKQARGEGTFPQHLYNQFQASNEALKQYLSSPKTLETNGKIEVLKARVKSLPKAEKEDIKSLLKEINNNIIKYKKLSKSKKTTPEKIKLAKEDIAKLEIEKQRYSELLKVSDKEKLALKEQIKELRKKIEDEAPDAAKTWEGKLHKTIEGDDDLVESKLWSQVEQTVDHILGDSDAQLLNPILANVNSKTKPFMSRKLIIDQLQASPWHITDIQKIAEAHNRAMVPTIKLQRFAQNQGYKDIDDFLLGVGENLRTEFDRASIGVTGKEAQDLRAQYESNLVDMKAAIQMLQGVYGQGFNVLNNSAAQFFNNVLDWNYTRMLGHMTLASLPELGLLVMRNGLMDTLAKGIGGSFSTIKQISKNDLSALGYAVETELGTKFKSYIEHAGLSTNPSPFTKGLDSLTRKFGNLSLMNPWTDMIQNMAGHLAINRILHNVHRAVEGKATNKQLTELARLGIDQNYFKTIAEFTKNNIHNGTRYANWTTWDISTGLERDSLRSFQAAVSKGIDEIAIMPHFGDKPLMLQQKGAFGNLSKLMFQFKSYLMAATNRVFYSAVQNKGDINLYLGAVSMMGLGMLGYIASSVSRGSEPDLSLKNLIREGLDRSAILGLYGEGINIAQKLLQLGEVSRYKSRDAFGSALGPTGGSASQLVSLFNKVNPLSNADGGWTTKDAEAVMRLMPLQNLFYLQRINRQIAHSAAVSLGATEIED